MRMFSQQPVQMREQCVSRLIMGSIPQVNPIRAAAATILFYIFVTARKPSKPCLVTGRVPVEASHHDGTKSFYAGFLAPLDIQAVNGRLEFFATNSQALLELAPIVQVAPSSLRPGGLANGGQTKLRCLASILNKFRESRARLCWRRIKPHRYHFIASRRSLSPHLFLVWCLDAHANSRKPSEGCICPQVTTRILVVRLVRTRPQALKGEI